MSSGKQGFDNPTAETNFGGNANPPQGTPYPQPGGQGMACAPPQQGIAYAPPQQGMGYNQNSNTAVIVNQPGAPGFVIQQPRPPDYMVASIFACLFCFCPTGLCAIYYATRVNSLADMGDMVGAADMAKNARNLMITSIVIGIIPIVLMIVIAVIQENNNNHRY